MYCNVIYCIEQICTVYSVTELYLYISYYYHAYLAFMAIVFFVCEHNESAEEQCTLHW